MRKGRKVTRTIDRAVRRLRKGASAGKATDRTHFHFAGSTDGQRWQTVAAPGRRRLFAAVRPQCRVALLLAGPSKASARFGVFKLGDARTVTRWAELATHCGARPRRCVIRARSSRAVPGSRKEAFSGPPGTMKAFRRFLSTGRRATCVATHFSSPPCV